LDVVIANAGVMATPFGHTADGFETQFGTNQLGHFVLVDRIAALIRDGGWLINLSSAGHRYANVDLDDPNFERTPYDPMLAYGRSKTANILLAVALDKRHRDSGVRAVAVHPGGIQTEMGPYQDPSRTKKNRPDKSAACSSRQRSIPVEDDSSGNTTSVWAAVVASADEIGGQYCEDCHVSHLVPNGLPVGINESVRSYALDPNNAEALWKKSEELVGESFD
jgi:NAD(P)-dependent dehydrogenase (short-subunit alcohol dehydrogenase family)